jgi:5-methylcytosine-specific restriction endonuclease McrA
MAQPMGKENSKKRRSLRRRLMESGQRTCFYCGLPFNAFILPPNSPGAAKSRRFGYITLEHLLSRSLGGETTIENCVLAHAWCNSTASNRTLADKHSLKEKLSGNSGLPPWWPELVNIVTKQNL